MTKVNIQIMLAFFYIYFFTIFGILPWIYYQFYPFTIQTYENETIKRTPNELLFTKIGKYLLASKFYIHFIYLFLHFANKIGECNYYIFYQNLIQLLVVSHFVSHKLLCLRFVFYFLSLHLWLRHIGLGTNCSAWLEKRAYFFVKVEFIYINIDFNTFL